MSSVVQSFSEAIAEKQWMERQKGEMEIRIIAIDKKIEQLRTDWIKELRGKNHGYYLDRK